MTQEQKNAFDTVEKINQELYAKFTKNTKRKDYDSMPILSITLANSYIFISLNLQSSNLEMPEIKLYNSYNNDRIYYEKQDKYESFYKFIKRKFLAIKSEINNIKL